MVMVHHLQDPPIHIQIRWDEDDDGDGDGDGDGREWGWTLNRAIGDIVCLDSVMVMQMDHDHIWKMKCPL